MTSDTKLKFGLLLILWAAAFIPVFPGMIEIWLSDSNTSHGLLVPLVSVYLIWRKRSELSTLHISTCNWGLVVLIASLSVFLASLSGEVAFLARSMIVLSVTGLVLFNLGTDFFKKIAFPLLFLLFMVPVPDTVTDLIAFPLQLLATKVSTAILHVLSIPAYRDGNMVYFAHAQLEVAESCSGIHSMVSMIMLSALLSHFLERGWMRRLILLVAAVPLALLSNITRVSGTGILAHFYGSRVARGFLHEFSGLVVFGFGLCTLLALYFFLNRGVNREQ